MLVQWSRVCCPVITAQVRSSYGIRIGVVVSESRRVVCFNAYVRHLVWRTAGTSRSGKLWVGMCLGEIRNVKLSSIFGLKCSLVLVVFFFSAAGPHFFPHTVASHVDLHPGFARFTLVRRSHNFVSDESMEHQGHRALLARLGNFGIDTTPRVILSMPYHNIKKGMLR